MAPTGLELPLSSPPAFIAIRSRQPPAFAAPGSITGRRTSCSPVVDALAATTGGAATFGGASVPRPAPDRRHTSAADPAGDLKKN